MKQYNTFEEALVAQANEGGYDNSFNGWSSDNSLIANIPFALKPVLWVIMAEDSSLGDYEESATEYGVDALGRWPPQGRRWRAPELTDGDEHP